MHFNKKSDKIINKTIKRKLKNGSLKNFVDLNFILHKFYLTNKFKNLQSINKVFEYV